MTLTLGLLVGTSHPHGALSRAIPDECVRGYIFLL